MSSFPPANWEVRFLRDMDTMSAEQGDPDDINMEAYLAIRPADGEEGHFRFVLSGPRDLRLFFPVTKVLPEEKFSGMNVEAHFDTEDMIQLEKNSACSNWIDIADMVSSQDADIVNNQGEIVSEQFLALLEGYKKSAPAIASGISLRWMLGTTGDSRDVSLIAQALPCSINVIEANPSLKSDHTRGILVEKFPVQYDR